MPHKSGIVQDVDNTIHLPQEFGESVGSFLHSYDVRPQERRHRPPAILVLLVSINIIVVQERPENSNERQSTSVMNR